VRRRRSQAAAARHKGDTPPAGRLPRTSAHSHQYSASGVVLHLPRLRLRRPRRTTETANSASTRKTGDPENRRTRCARPGPRCPGEEAIPWRTRGGRPHPTSRMLTPPASKEDIARPLRRRRGISTPPPGRLAADCAILDPAVPPHRASRSTSSLAPPPPHARGGAPPRRGRCGPRLPPKPDGKRASRSPRRRRRRANRTTGRPPPVHVTAPAEDDGGRRRRASRAGGKTAADWAALDPTAPPQRTEKLATASPRPSAGRNTPSLPPPPPPARGGAPARRERCGPRLPPTPGGKRASRSPRRRRRRAYRTTGRPPPVDVTAPADYDGGRRRRASRAGGKTAADWAALDSAAPPQRTEHLATAPRRPSAAPAEAPRRCGRRRHTPGAVRHHAEGVAAPDFPLRQVESAPRGARAAVVAAPIGRREDLPPSASPRPPTMTEQVKTRVARWRQDSRRLSRA